MSKDLRDEPLRVKSSTDTTRLAKSIAATYTKEGKDGVTLRAIGAGAVNQAVKAYVISKGILSQKGINQTVDMQFKDVDDNITAVEFVIAFAE